MSVAVSKRDRGIDRVSPELKTHLRQVIGGIVCASCSGVASGRLRLVLGWEDGPPCSNRLEVAVLCICLPAFIKARVSHSGSHSIKSRKIDGTLGIISRSPYHIKILRILSLRIILRFMSPWRC